MNLYDYLLANTKSADTAVIFGDEQITYGELVETSESVGFTLARSGVRKGDRVGLLADNSPFWIASYLGTLKVGAVATPFPSRLGTSKFRQMADVIGCSAFCFDRKNLAKYAAEIPPCSTVLTGPELATSEALTGRGSIVAIERGASSTIAVQEREDLASLMFTSGSTGQPNAVRVSHRNIMANTESIIEALGLAADDRMMVVLPFDYCFGTSLLHTHLRVGATLVINNGFQYIEDVLNDMERSACTSFAGVPLIYQQLLRRSSFVRRDLPSLRSAQQAGGKLANVFIKEFLAAKPHTQLHVMYGQTEATARMSYLPAERLEDKLGSIGRGLPGVQLHVLDDDDRPVAPGESGEIVAEGDNVALGYWQPDPAKNNFRNGRLYTGDLAEVDSEGFIYVVGRAGDFVKPQGYRISCREIEDVLAEIPEIAEVAVVGVSHAELGEVVRAYLVTTQGVELGTDHIRKFCRGRLADYAVPREFVYLTELPRNGSQKVVKRLLPV